MKFEKTLEEKIVQLMKNLDLILNELEQLNVVSEINIFYRHPETHYFKIIKLYSKEGLRYK